MTTMFTDAWVPCVDCDSVEISKKSFSDQPIQTEPYKIIHRGSQSRRVKGVQCQTDEYELPNQPCSDSGDSSTAIIDFVKRAEIIMTEELKKNSCSRAFKSLKTDLQNKISLKQTAELSLESGVKYEFSVTCLSWNSTGAVLGAAYGSLNHDGWCVHTGAISLWNAARLENSTPNQKLDTNSCVTCLSFHPTMPSLLAAGTFTGEILVYNIAAETECLIATNGCNDAGHLEGVNQIEWLTGIRGTDSGNRIVGGDLKQSAVERFLTIGSDGKILCWTLDSHRRSALRCSKIFQIRNRDQGTMSTTDYLSTDTAQTRTGHTTNNTHNERAVSLTSAALCPDQPNRLVVGTDSGGIMLCNLDCPGAADTLDNATHPSPVEFALNRQSGPISSVDWSKHHRNLVLSCGIGSTLQVHNTLQRGLSISIDPTRGRFLAAKFSPHFPNLVVCTTGTGSLALYNLLDGRGQGDVAETDGTEPKLLFETNEVTAAEEKCPASKIALAFNTKNASLLATGDENGVVHLWEIENVCDGLTTIVDPTVTASLFPKSVL